MNAEPLVCPSCATTHPLSDRFCRKCGMPLVYAGRTGVEDPVTEQHERARKVKPQYSEGPLVRVAGVRNQAEAEMVQGMLLEEGVPSLLRRTRGFDVPDFLAAGPRDVLVPQSGADVARDVLLSTESPGAIAAEPPTGGARPWRVLAGLLIAVVVVAVIAWAGTHWV
ncbi:MAG TPA: hypothetical protein VGY97_01575 [Solirubrobacteraceae bacterium]|nr:hypothetical protein [Solirubrobacteraceae bacterium]